jgi:adhesin transport system outer membrane protein
MQRHLFQIMKRLAAPRFLGGVLLLGICQAAVHAEAAETLLLEQAIVQAVTNAPSLKAQASRVDAADAAVAAAHAGYLPTLSLNYGIGQEKATNSSLRLLENADRILAREDAAVQLSQPLFDSLRTPRLIRQRRAERETQQLITGADRQALALEVANVYLFALFNRDLGHIAAENVADHETIFDLLNRKFAGGVIGVSDLSLTESRLYRARAQEALARREEANALTSLERLTGTPPAVLDWPVLPEDLAATLPATLAEGLERLWSRNPGLAAASARHRASRAAIGVSTAEMLPRVSLDGEIDYSDNASGINTYDNEQRVMLRMRWTPFDGGATLMQRRQRTAEAAASRWLVNDARIRLREQYALAYETFVNSGPILANLETSAQNSIAAFDQVQAQFRVGKRSLFDLLDIKNELFLTRRQLIEVRFQRLQAWYALLSYDNSLVASTQQSSLK